VLLDMVLWIPAAGTISVGFCDCSGTVQAVNVAIIASTITAMVDKSNLISSSYILKKSFHMK
jgi:hypothetical protein